MEHIVDMFLKKTGCNDDRSYDTMCQVFFIYFELAITLFFAVSSYLSIANSTEGLSVRLYGLLCFLIESHIFFFIAVRLYYLPQFRDMYQRTLKMGIPENFRQRIAIVIKHHLIISNVFVSVSMLYTISMDWVQMGDPFTFPFIDVLPIKTTNLTIYVCKYILYTLPVYIAYFETCFLNVTFMYSTGVVKRYFQILDGQVEEAIANKDEQQLKIAIKHHQEVLKFFDDMKTAYEKPILMTIEFCGLYVGLTSYFSILVIQHDGILSALFEHRSVYSGNNSSFKRLISIMMTRATIPLEFKVASIFTINLNLLIKILKFVYTVFNVLLTSISRKLKETAI
ncbi:odorant receptor 43b-like [Aphis craccivora]|uniref:Odorant receptor 43b-like n=1 Tax=Aphis craccivora TaxID=307492 RepID=A0A6G0Z6A5_APHCR|nr:odorant receptor 43b-like [Aphis craccivora]